MREPPGVTVSLAPSSVWASGAVAGRYYAGTLKTAPNRTEC